MAITTKSVTAETLFHMPDDGYRYELVKGELRKMTPAGSRHGVVIANLTGFLVPHINGSRLGIAFGAETGFRIVSHPDTVRAPDIAFIKADRLPSSGIPETFWDGAPDLAVEVLSPSDSKSEVEEQVTDWLSAGTSLVWVVDPKNCVVRVHRPQSEVRTLSESDVLDGEDVVPGFRCPIVDLFTHVISQP